MVVFELTFPVGGRSTSSPLRVRLPIEPGDYTITVDAGADVEIKRCVRADDDPTWSSGSAVDVTEGAFTIDSVTDRRLLADIAVTSSAPIEVCRVQSV
jgi:hypothetical protein